MSVAAHVEESAFYYNSGGEGGGIACGGALTVKNSTFTGNSAFSVASAWPPAGGAIGSKDCTANIAGSTFFGNSTTNKGGAISIDGTFSITNSTFHGNSANKGGAVFNHKDAKSTLKNNTISGNSVGVVGKTTAEGSGIYHEGASMTLVNTIVADNTGDENCVAVDEAIMDGGGNLRWPQKSTSCPGKTANPLLAPLGDYGGPTQTMALLPGSAAIDAGDDDSCANTDQRGISRPRLSHCDVGAFESRGFLKFIVDGDKQSTFLNGPFPRELKLFVFSRWDEPTEGGRVWFASPARGAGTNPRNTTVTISESMAKTRAAANGTAGSYEVKAQARGIKSPSRFHLTNKTR